METENKQTEFPCDFPNCTGGRTGHGRAGEPYVAHSQKGLDIHKWRKHDPEGNRLATIVAHKMKRKQKSKWFRMTREQRAAHVQKNMERRRLKTGVVPINGIWECPYCDFSTTTTTHKTRHLRDRHPNETGMVEFREHATNVAKNIDAMVPETLEDRIVRAVADRIYNDIKGGINNR